MKRDNPDAPKEQFLEMVDDMPIDNSTKAFLKLEIKLM